MNDTLKLQRILEREQQAALYRMKKWVMSRAEKARDQPIVIQGCPTDPVYHAYLLLNGIIARNTSFQTVCMDIDTSIMRYITEQQTYVLELAPPTNEFMRIWYQHYIDTFMKALYWVRQEYPMAAHYSYILRLKKGKG